MKHLVYSMFFNDRLVYVGCTSDIDKRLKSHHIYCTLKKYGEVRIETERANTKADAYIAEGSMIWEKNPPLNFQKNPNSSAPGAVSYLLSEFVSVDFISYLIDTMFSSQSPEVRKELRRYLECKSARHLAYLGTGYDRRRRTKTKPKIYSEVNNGEFKTTTKK